MTNDAFRAEDWVDIILAHERVNRSQRTIRRWVKDGLIQTLHPGRTIWVNVPDLVRVESEMAVSKPRRARPPTNF